MRKYEAYKRRLSQRKQGSVVQPPPSSPSSAPAGIDVALQRLANASQLGLLALAIFGYFYTVLPVYQKSLLDEEIAKKTLQLNAMETKLASAEDLLAKKEAEIRSMDGKLGALREEADSARRGLNVAKAEVGKLKTDVQEKYSELRPRVLRDFQAVALRECKLSAIPAGTFADCIRRKVVVHPLVQPLSEPDRKLLIAIAEQQNASVTSAWADFVAKEEAVQRDFESRKTDADARCAQMKSAEDYKDPYKKPKIDNDCSSEQLRISSDRLSVAIKRYSEGDVVLPRVLSGVVASFLNSPRPSAVPSQ